MRRAFSLLIVTIIGTPLTTGRIHAPVLSIDRGRSRQRSMRDRCGKEIVTLLSENTRVEATVGGGARSARAGWFERYAWLVFAVSATACLAGQLLRARAKPFWHDEIYTILHSSLPSIGTMWAAGIDGFDLAPPLNTLVTRVVQQLLGVGLIASRVPPMAGYLVMSVVIFFLLKRRANTVVALSGSLLPYFTPAYAKAYEARPYGLMVGLFALALLAWSEAAQERRRGWSLVVLAVALGASIWNHFYGVLTFAPIVAGEAVRAVQRRRLDVGVIAALAAAVLLALPLSPLAATASAQSASFWARANVSDLREAYESVLGALLGRRFTITGAMIVVLLLFTARPKSSATGPRFLPAHEITAGLVSLLIPAIGVALGVLVTGVFNPRYAISAVVGFSLVIPLAVWHRRTAGGIAERLLCLVLVVSVGIDVGRTIVSPPVFSDPFLDRPVLQAALASGSPVVVANGLDYLTYWYYAPAAQKPHLLFLADAEAAQQYMKFDTIDRGYLALGRWTAVPVKDFDDYVTKHPVFQAYGIDDGWLRAGVTARGGTISDIHVTPTEKLVTVRMER